MYVYTYVISGFVMPAMLLLFKVIVNKTAKDSKVHFLFLMALPPMMKPLPEEPLPEQVRVCACVYVRMCTYACVRKFICVYVCVVCACFCWCRCRCTVLFR